MIRMMVTEYLEEGGHHVLTAENGQEAIDLLRAGQEVEIILLDYNMPVLDGPGFLKKNSAEKVTNASVIMMTTETGMQKISEMISLGAKEYIMKPFEKKVLFEKIESVVEN